jgi:hypothetical protein
VFDQVFILEMMFEQVQGFFSGHRNSPFNYKLP